jgi:hypothetical protein
MVHTAVMMHAMSRTFLPQKIFGSSCCLGLRENNCDKYHSTEARQSLLTNHKRLGGYKWKWGALCIYRMSIELHSYDLCGVLDAGAGSLLRLRDGRLHHRLKGALRVPAPETCQHMLHHYLHQGTALFL